MRRRCACILAICLAAVASDGALAQAPPFRDVATLLFEQSMWRDAHAGSILRYGFARRTPRKVLGGSFDDDIIVKLGPGADAESRTSEIRMFSGDRTRPTGPFFSGRVNPVLVLVMEQNVQELSRLTGLEPGRLKDAIRKAWRDDARIAEVPVDVAGRQVAGTRITVTPFILEPAHDKLKGLDRLTYAVEIADGIPGHIARIDIRTAAGRAPVFSETLHYIGSKAP